MKSRVDMTIRVGTVELPNPVMTASGTSGHGAELGAYFDLSTLGAVVVKSLSAEPWPGNPAPRVHETDAGMLNSVGLQNPGVEAWVEEELPELLATGARVVASIWGSSVAGYEKAAAALAGVSAQVIAVEVNLSCPNLEHGRHMFAAEPSATREAMEATAGCGRPRWAKLSPNVTDITEIAGAALTGGADALTLVNTVKGMAIDPVTHRPRLGAGGGGLSGRPSGRWRCGPSTTAARPSRSPGWLAWAGSPPASTPSSCCWPGPTPCRSAPPPSPTPGRRPGSSRSCGAGVAAGESRGCQIC